MGGGAEIHNLSTPVIRFGSRSILQLNCQGRQSNKTQLYLQIYKTSRADVKEVATITY